MRPLSQRAIAQILLIFLVDLSILSRCLGAAGDEYWDERWGVPGANGPIYSLLTIGSEIYGAGSFTQIGGVDATNIAKWDGTTWQPLGSGLSGGALPEVYAMAGDSDGLYVVGFFTRAGASTVNNVARWDGTNWTALGAGLNGGARAVVKRRSEIFVGGSFSRAGGLSATNLARWNGTRWEAVGGGITGTAVDALAATERYVFAGGRFRAAGTAPATNVAMWDGTNWLALGNGLRNFDGFGGDNGSVRSLFIKGNALFAGGDFRLAGNVSATNLAIWDRQEWFALNSSVSAGGRVYVLAGSGMDLYAGGFFSQAGTAIVNDIAKWSGSYWVPLGVGLQDRFGSAAARAFAATGSELFVGGFFATAGDKPSTNIALWHIPHALDIQRWSDAVILSWPSTGTNFLLEASTELPSTTWTEVSRPVSLQAGRCVVTEPITATNRFYRLRRKPW